MSAPGDLCFHPGWAGDDDQLERAIALNLDVAIDLAMLAVRLAATVCPSLGSTRRINAAGSAAARNDDNTIQTALDIRQTLLLTHRSPLAAPPAHWPSRWWRLSCSSRNSCAGSNGIWAIWDTHCATCTEWEGRNQEINANWTKAPELRMIRRAIHRPITVVDLLRDDRASRTME